MISDIALEFMYYRDLEFLRSNENLKIFGHLKTFLACLASLRKEKKEKWAIKLNFLANGESLNHFIKNQNQLTRLLCQINPLP